MAERKLLNPEQAKAYYDHFGSKQDHQGWYEQPALDDLAAHARLGEAKGVFELGCGTGRFAAELLERHLPRGCRYLGVDVSDTMIGLARQRLAAVPNTEVRKITADGPLEAPDAAFDRFITSYVFDLLPEARTRQLLAEAHRLLQPGGLLCAAGITPGPGPFSAFVSGLWNTVHRINPALVGGCRPLVLAGLVESPHWHIVHRNVVVAWGIASEVLVAERT